MTGGTQGTAVRLDQSKLRKVTKLLHMVYVRCLGVFAIEKTILTQRMASQKPEPI